MSLLAERLASHSAAGVRHHVCSVPCTSMRRCARDVMGRGSYFTGSRIALANRSAFHVESPASTLHNFVLAGHGRSRDLAQGLKLRATSSVGPQPEAAFTAPSDPLGSSCWPCPGTLCCSVMSLSKACVDIQCASRWIGWARCWRTCCRTSTASYLSPAPWLTSLVRILEPALSLPEWCASEQVCAS